MKKALLLACMMVSVLVTSFRAGAEPTEEGVALAIIYDTSGSMQESVRDNTGGTSPKYTIGNRALTAIDRQIAAFATNSTAARRVECCLLTFQGEGARESIPMSRFTAGALAKWAREFKTPTGHTPLGNALDAASRAVLASPLSRKHVLVITDGENTSGPGPESVLPRIKQRAAQKGAVVSVHFVGFDVAARVFEPLKKQGATVVSAQDEKQLDSQLEYILQKKILLEDEEPQQKK